MRTLDGSCCRVAVFAGLTPYARADRGLRANVGFEAGETLFREGDPAELFYVVRHGRVALETFVPGRGPLDHRDNRGGDGRRLVVALRAYRWHFDARALRPCGRSPFDGACLRGKCDDDPALGYELMQRFAAVLLERLQRDAAAARSISTEAAVAAEPHSIAPGPMVPMPLRGQEPSA